MYRRTMSATMDGRAIKAPRFSAPMVRCSTSRSSHVTGGTTSTAQRLRRSIGIHTFHSSVNYGLLFLFVLSFLLWFLYLCPLPSPLLLFTSFSLPNAFTFSFTLKIYYYYYHHHHYNYPTLHFVSIYNRFILLPLPPLFVLFILLSMLFLFV